MNRLGTKLPPRRTVGPVEISITSYQELVTLCLEWAQERRAGATGAKTHYVCVTDAHSLILANDDGGFAHIINSADVATPDGMPIVWALRSFGVKNQPRVYGPTLMLHLCEAAAREGIRVFLYGSREETLRLLREKLKARYPGLAIAGSHSPPFRALTTEEDEAEQKIIRESDADIVFVGMGTPKQDRWMFDHREVFAGVTMIGVGAAFDFHAGRTVQAPLWIQNNGLEWLFRLLTEPLRLWKRYLLITPRFLPLWFMQWMRHKTGG